MVDYLNVIHSIQEAFTKYPEVSQLIKYKLNNTEDAQYVDFYPSQENPQKSFDFAGT